MSKFQFPEENTLKTLVAQYVARRCHLFLAIPPKGEPFLAQSSGNLRCMLPPLGNIARLPIPRRSPDGDDRSGCGIFAVVANRRCQDSVGIDRPCQLARRREGPTEAIQPADYRQPQGASPPPGLRRHVLCPHPKKPPGDRPKSWGVGGSRVTRVPAPFLLRVFPGPASGELK